MALLLVVDTRDVGEVVLADVAFNSRLQLAHTVAKAL